MPRLKFYKSELLILFVQLSNCVSNETTYHNKGKGECPSAKQAFCSQGNCCYKLNKVNVLITSGP